MGLMRACVRTCGGRPRKGERGQMTVEFVVALPAMIVIAAIAVNALSFFASCAAFDGNFRDLVRVCATSPAYGQDGAASAAAVEEALAATLSQDNLSSRVQVRSVAGGHMAYSATLQYAPTLFGLGLKDEVLGVSLPKLVHSEELVVDTYKPGVLF